MDAQHSPFTVDPADVFAMISTKMRANAERVVVQSKRRGCVPHAAARQIAQGRVREAMRLRGQIPA
jgi:glutamate dehydrogenase (NAD(P)+)